LKVSLTEIPSDATKESIATELRKAANELAPPKKESTGSRRFPLPAGSQIFEHFDNLMKKTISDLKSDIEKILA